MKDSFYLIFNAAIILISADFEQNRGGGGPPPPSPIPPSYIPPAVPGGRYGALPSNQFSCSILQGTNAHRTLKGRAPLLGDKRLDASAMIECQNMAALGILDHTTYGQGPDKRIEQAGYNWQAIAENIYDEKGYGNLDPVRVLQGWIKSPGHEKNMVGDYHNLGSAFCSGRDGKIYWAQDFGKGDSNPGLQYDCSIPYGAPPPPPLVPAPGYVHLPVAPGYAPLPVAPGNAILPATGYAPVPAPAYVPLPVPGNAVLPVPGIGPPPVPVPGYGPPPLPIPGNAPAPGYGPPPLPIPGNAPAPGYGPPPLPIPGNAPAPGYGPPPLPVVPGNALLPAPGYGPLPAPAPGPPPPLPIQTALPFDQGKYPPAGPPMNGYQAPLPSQNVVPFNDQLPLPLAGPVYGINGRPCISSSFGYKSLVKRSTSGKKSERLAKRKVKAIVLGAQ